MTMESSSTSDDLYQATPISETTSELQPADRYVTEDIILQTKNNSGSLEQSTVHYGSSINKITQILKSVYISPTDESQHDERSKKTDNFETANYRNKDERENVSPRQLNEQSTPTMPLFNVSESEYTSVLPPDKSDDTNSDLMTLNLLSSDPIKRPTPPESLPSSQAVSTENGPIALPIISYYSKEETPQAIGNTSETYQGSGEQSLNVEKQHFSTSLDTSGYIQPTTEASVKQTPGMGTGGSVTSPDTSIQATVTSPQNVQHNISFAFTLSQTKSEFINLTLLESERPQPTETSIQDLNPLELQTDSSTEKSQGEGNVSTLGVKTEDSETNVIMNATTQATQLPVSFTDSVINTDKTVSTNNVYNVTELTAVKSAKSVTSKLVPNRADYISTSASSTLPTADFTKVAKPMTNVQAEWNTTKAPLLETGTEILSTSHKLSTLNKERKTTPTAFYKSSTMKTANRSAVVPNLVVDSHGKISLVPIVVPAILTVAVLVALVVGIFIYRRKCRSSSKYRKGLDDEESNEALEEKVYLELIYAKIDLSKKCKYRNGPDNKDESTPLTLEDSSNNNSTLNNREKGDVERGWKDSDNASSCESDVFDEDPIEPAVYENTKIVFEPLEEFSPPVPVRNTPKTSPKTPQSSRHGKFSPKCSPCISNRSRKNSSNRIEKSERNSSSSPERTPKCKRTSPKVRKSSRSPLIGKNSRGVCWNTQKSEENISQNEATGTKDDLTTLSNYHGKETGVLDIPASEAMPEPVACSSRCNGACGGACGISSPDLPREKPLTTYSRKKELPPEPESEFNAAEVEPGIDAADTSGMQLARIGQPDNAELGQQGATALNHSYDPVYVPRSDASAMNRRLDKAGYVTSKLQRAKARGDPYADVLDMNSRDDRPIPTIIGPPIMRRRPASRANSDRSTNERRLSKSSQCDNPQDHVYSSVEGARESSSTEHGSVENVYASVTEHDEEACQDEERMYDTAGGPNGSGDEIYGGLDCIVPSPDSDNGELNVNTPGGVYYSTPADNQSTASEDDVTYKETAENPYEAVSFNS